MNINELRERINSYPNELKAIVAETLGGWGFYKSGGVVTVARVRTDGTVVINLKHPEVRNAEDVAMVNRWFNESEHGDDVHHNISTIYGIDPDELKIQWKIMKRAAPNEDWCFPVPDADADWFRKVTGSSS